MTELYPYATGPLLEKRNSYAYSPYHGASFLKAWRADRDRARAACIQVSDNLSARNITPEGRVLPDWSLPARSVDLLATLDNALRQETFDPAAEAVLDRLVQRFEVTKRIHAEYGPDWRALNVSDYTDLGLILAFAETVATAQEKEARLDLLNVLLKALDTLSAYIGTLSKPQRTRLAELIEREAIFVDTLRAEVAAR